MSKISTKEIPDTNAGIPKVLRPGNSKITVNGIFIKQEPFPGDPVHIVLHVEGEDLGGDFTGFEYDKDHPELGKAKGQIGKVRAQEYTFTNEAIGGKQRDKQRDMLMWLHKFCKQLGILEWLKGEDDKHDTVEDLVRHMDREKPFKGIWLDSCLAGRAYNSNKGFVNYDLFFPWFGQKRVPFEIAGTNSGDLITFNEELHITKKKSKAASVDSFEGKRKPGTDLEL